MKIQKQDNLISCCLGLSNIVGNWPKDKYKLKYKDKDYLQDNRPSRLLLGKKQEMKSDFALCVRNKVLKGK